MTKGQLPAGGQTEQGVGSELSCRLPSVSRCARFHFVELPGGEDSCVGWAGQKPASVKLPLRPYRKLRMGWLRWLPAAGFHSSGR